MPSKMELIPKLINTLGKVDCPSLMSSKIIKKDSNCQPKQKILNSLIFFKAVFEVCSSAPKEIYFVKSCSGFMGVTNGFKGN